MLFILKVQRKTMMNAYHNGIQGMFIVNAGGVPCYINQHGHLVQVIAHGHQAHGHPAHGYQAHGHQAHGHQAHGHQAHGHQARGHQAQPKFVPPSTLSCATYIRHPMGKVVPKLYTTDSEFSALITVNIAAEENVLVRDAGNGWLKIKCRGHTGFMRAH